MLDDAVKEDLNACTLDHETVQVRASGKIASDEKHSRQGIMLGMWMHKYLTCMDIGN